VITPVAVQRSTVRWEMPFMHVITIALAVLGLTGGKIVLWEGIVLWGFFLVYLGYLFRMAKNGDSEAEEETVMPLWKQLLMLVVGVTCIVFGSDLTVDNATVIAEAFGMDDRLIGLTIVAFGTSLPEMVTSIMAAKKGNADIAIGNIVGSNVFNILFVVGTTALITPVAFKAGFLIDSAIALAAGLILWFGVMKEHKLKRPVGIVMLAAYAVYFVYLLMG
jgi:cation:H+ antiporter